MTVDLAIVGAGPAGSAAAGLAAELGLDTLLIDEQESPGGQIYRAVERAPDGSPLGADYLAGRPLVAALRAGAARYRPPATGSARPSRRGASCWRPARSSGRCRSRAGPCPA